MDKKLNVIYPQRIQKKIIQMGLFDKLFGRKNSSSKEGGNKTVSGKTNPEKNPSKKQNNFITNSAEFGLGEIALGISGKIRVDGILAFAAMEKIAKEQNKPFDFKVMYTTLLEEGALTIPVVCSIGETKYSLYFIYKEEELLKYKDLVMHVGRTDYPNLIYFSSIPIYDGYIPKPIIEPFQLADLRFEQNAKIAGPFAMWWSTESDPTFHNSKTYEHLNKMYQILKGYETYIAGYVLRQTRIIQEVKLQRMKLPENPVTYVINAPEGKQVLLILSQEKGIRFLFPVNNTTQEYRERFLRGAMVDMAATAIPLRQQNAPIDEATDPNGFDWFNFMTRVIKEKEEAGERIEQIGGMNLNSQMN